MRHGGSRPGQDMRIIQNWSVRRGVCMDLNGCQQTALAFLRRGHRRCLWNACA